MRSTLKDDPFTVAAIAILAYCVADLAHEVLGHGIPYLLFGGRSFVMTTTRFIIHRQSFIPAGIDPSLYTRLADLGGPAGNFVFAALASVWLRLRKTDIHLRLFLALTVAFNLFWATGYMLASALFDYGDWLELIRGLHPAWLGRFALALAGAFAYRWSFRIATRAIGGVISLHDLDWRSRARRLLWISYLASGIVACLGAAFDPRGPSQIYESAAPTTFLGALPLLYIPQVLPRLDKLPPAEATPIARGKVWIFVGLAATVLYVALLGPGIPINYP